MKDNKCLLLNITEKARNEMSNLEVLNYFHNIKRTPLFKIKYKERIYSYDELIPEAKVFWNSRLHLIENYSDDVYVVASDTEIIYIGDSETARKIEYKHKKETGFGFFRTIKELKNWTLLDR